RMIQSVPATSVLPVEFGSFNVTEDAGTAILDWTTYTETNNAGFEVEHRTSTDLPYQSLGFVTGQGTTVEPQSYQFVTPALEPGVHRFRLRQVDFDGTQTVTDEISVEIALPAAVTLALSAPAPNPATAFARARLTSATSQPVIVEVFDALGRRVSTVFDGRVDGGQTIELSVSLDALPNGLYFLRASTPTALKTRALSIVK
ncbi:MAG: T9SS type A sorting domain-containing protein, partial [Bacteroidota bacterium]